jgi:putative oxidoreductase
MDVVLLVGRILFGLVFLGSAMGHLTQTDAMAGYAGSKGVPAARAATIVSGVVMVVGALLVILGWWGDLGALLLALFLIPTAFVMHAFWKETEPMEKQMEQIQFMKDLSLAGAALVLLWLFSQVGEVPLALGDGLF